MRSSAAQSGERCRSVTTLPQFRNLSATSSIATKALLSHTFDEAKSRTTRSLPSILGSSCSRKEPTDPKKSGPDISYTVLCSIESVLIGTEVFLASIRCELLYAYPRALSTTPENTATARLVTTVTPVTNTNTVASVFGIFRIRANEVQSKMSRTKQSIVPASAAIGTRSMNPAPNVTYDAMAIAHVKPETRVRPPA